ncbi:MAG: type IV pilus assembly protein PilM [Deltaproteobacteria bacterium]|nr:type IV pilus assembly protein PilM [Deltaproteobacteria bacterium]
MAFLGDFFGDIRNFFRGGTVLGVDIGTSSIKVVELKKAGDKFTLRNYGILETKDYLNHPNAAIQTSSLRINEDDAAAALKLLLNDMKPKTELAVATLPVFTTFTTMLDFPDLPPAEVEKAIQFQAPQYVPIPMAQVSTEWRKIGEYTDKDGRKHQRIILTATPNDVVKNYERVFKRAGLRLIALEHEPFAIARALKGSLTDIATLVIDIGAQSTSAIIINKGVVEYVGQTDVSGIYLTQALSRSLEVSMSRSEELKRRRGLLGTGPEAELSTILLPFLDVIIQETRHVKELFETQFGKRVEKVMFIGGGASLAGIDKYASGQLNLMLGTHSFMQGLNYPKELIPALRDLENRLLVAFGCAKRYFKQ